MRKTKENTKWKITLLLNKEQVEKIKELHNKALDTLSKTDKPNNNEIKKEIILNWSICGPSSMYKKSIFTKVGNFDENLIIEDWDMFIRLVKANSLAFIPEIVASYRIHKKNT